MKPMDKNEISKIVAEVIQQKNLAEKSVVQRTSPISSDSQAFHQSSRAAVLVAPKQFEIQEFPIREIGDDEMLVKVEACGICGTDIHCFNNDPFQLIPNVLGHEGTGVVVAKGKNVTMDGVNKPVEIGDVIVTSVMKTSEACVIAKYNPLDSNLCDDFAVYGLLPDEPDNHLNGYFAEYMIIRPGSNFYVVNGMNLNLRLLIEPAAVVAHALERAKSTQLLNFRSRVVVQGCGPIGLLTIAVVRTFGVNNIIAIDGNPSRLEMARKLGADHLINFKDFTSVDAIASKIRDLSKGLGAHFGFQTTGVPAAVSNLFKYIRRGGGICEIGSFVDNGECAINPHFDFCKKEINLVGSWAYNAWDYPNAYHFLQRASDIGLPVEELITHRFPLDQIQRAFETNIAQKGIKIVVEMG
jgi:L-iditol 2-dehydrogenase